MYIQDGRVYPFLSMWDVLLYFGWFYYRDKVLVNIIAACVVWDAFMCVYMAGHGSLFGALGFLCGAFLASVFPFLYVDDYMKALKGERYVAG